MNPTLQTFYFDTGVRPYAHNPPVPISKGMILRGTLQIPFACEVPENATFKFASNNPDAGPGYYRAEILSGEMQSKYAFFLITKH